MTRKKGLVLSRKTNESIVIGDDITVTVTSIEGNRIRLLIEAPRDVPVHRTELMEGGRNHDATAVSS